MKKIRIEDWEKEILAWANGLKVRGRMARRVKEAKSEDQVRRGYIDFEIVRGGIAK